ncbi:hypothetical protein [Microbacterium sp. NC79]|uniref:hypothetical protein n=1 Tax=Microbacterium sp. NC79 TaxID=2851009 RepID=UPI001C2BF839|nr:hypothetical protein [Microbacterium sp. NC79]MBV0895740.1 hypothetical protein [Microbacterium sp. NC79]
MRHADDRRREHMKVLELGTGALVSDLIPRTHADLRIARVFFPFETKDGELVPWTRFVPGDTAFSASTTWRDLLESAGQDPASYNAASGQLDERTAEGLRELIGDLTMTGLMWRGYWGTLGEPDYLATTWSNSTEVYVSRRFTADFIRAGMQVPEFAWDDEGRLAWGGFLYPDSLAVAVEPARLDALYGSGLLTATGARPDDTMPASSGD